MQKILRKQDFTDAIVLSRHLAEEDESDPINFFTYWSKEGASRLDRYYVKGDPYTHVQWVGENAPAWNSDHQEVRLELSDERKKQKQSGTPQYYPITSGKPDRVHQGIAAGTSKLTETFEACENPTKYWDDVIMGLQRLLQQVTKDDQRQSKIYFENIKAATRQLYETREGIQEAETIAAQKTAARSFGRTLQPSLENKRPFLTQRR